MTQQLVAGTDGNYNLALRVLQLSSFSRHAILDFSMGCLSAKTFRAFYALAYLKVHYSTLLETPQSQRSILTMQMDRVHLAPFRELFLSIYQRRRPKLPDLSEY